MGHFKTFTKSYPGVSEFVAVLSGLQEWEVLIVLYTCKNAWC